MAEIITVTPEGLKKLQDQLEYLKTTKRQEIKDAIKTAREFGDLSENSEYEAARTEQAQVEATILELEEQLKHVKVITDDNISEDKVSIGLTVKVRDLDSGSVRSYSLVGSNEVDPFAGKISDTSPIGRAIIGAKVGDTVVVKLPKGDVRIVIESIEK